MRATGTLATMVAAGALGLLSACGGGGSAGQGNPSLVDLLTTSMPAGTTGVFYEVQLEAEFPNPPGIYLRVGGVLPPGLSLDRVTGLISGYPRAVGVSTFAIAARDGNDPDVPPDRDANFAEDRQQFTLQVFRGPPNILPQTLPAAQYRSAYSYFIDIAGVTEPFTWALTGGSLPTGITLNPNTGELCCLPTAVNPAPGNPPFSFTVTVTDSGFPVPLQDTDTLELQVVVLPLTIATPSPAPPGAMGFPYDRVLLLASAGAGAPYTWSQLFPLGTDEVDLATLNMQITADGHLKSITPDGPNQVGTFLFTAKVIDEAIQIATRQYSITFSVGPVVTSISPNKSSVGGPYTITGLNFQPNATVIFKPGPTQVSPANVFIVDSTTITFPTAPAPPGGVGGFVTVRVRNPDGGFGDLLNGFAFPAASLTFSATPAFPATQSPLSSTGVDVADVNKDGFADIVHSGTSSSGWGNGSGTAGGVDVLVNAPADGVFNAASPPFTRVQLAIGGDWHTVEFSDINTDSYPDVVATGTVGGQRVVRTWLNVAGAFAPGTFTTGVLSTQNGGNPFFTPHVTDMALGRVDGDPVPDLMYAYQDGYDVSGTTVYVTGGSGYGWYSYQVTAMNGGSVTSVRGLGNGAFSTTNMGSTGRSIPTVIAVGGIGLGKFNADNLADVAIGDASGNGMSWRGAAYGNPTQLGSFSVTTPSSTFGSWNPLTHPAGGVAGGQVIGVAIGDVNGDTRDDIVLAQESSPSGTSGTFSSNGTPSLASYSGSGSGTFSELPIVKPGSRLRYPVIFDGDFDVSMDIAATAGTGTLSPTFNRIEVWKGRTATLGPLFRQAVTISVGSPKLGRIAAGDVSGDGRPDLVATLSFFADDYVSRLYAQYFGSGYHESYANRGNGGNMGVVFALNTSQ